MKPILCRIATGITLGFNWFISLFGSLFNAGKMVRRSIVYFAMYEIHFVIHSQMDRLEGLYLQIVIIAVIGMLATVLHFYTTDRNQDDKKCGS